MDLCFNNPLNGSTDPVRSFLDQVGRYPLLTPEQELSLGAKVQLMMKAEEKKQELEEIKGFTPTDKALAKSLGISAKELRQRYTEGTKARDLMINSNLRLVVKLAKRHTKRGIDLLDLIQEGAIGLKRGVEKFDPELKYRFSTYAYWWIKQAMSRAVAQQSRTIRLPDHLTERLNKIKKVTRQLTQELGRQPTYEEIGAAIEEPVEKVIDYLRVSRPIRSTDVLIGEKKENRLLDIIEDQNTEGPDEYSERMMVIDQVRSCVEKLPARERDVIILTYGLYGYDPLSLAEAEKVLNLSRETIRQIQVRAISIIKSKGSNLRDLVKTG